MRIKCHQAVQGHSRLDTYAAGLIVSQKDESKDSTKSIDFKFADGRRDISDDINHYVLEIQPVDSALSRPAAICSQWKTVGTPSIYTHWLIPEDGKTETAFHLLKRDYFMDGSEMNEYYESSKIMTMKEIEIDDEMFHPKWIMNESQYKTLTQFLALYWMSLTKRSMGANADIQLPLILRDENTNEILTNEKAAAFFAREIASRMPKEAQNMISVAFGLKWSEAQSNFKKTVCAVLSTEVGTTSEKKIDLMSNNRDLLSKYPHDDRVALNTIGNYLIEGEKTYPHWYMALREMREGIPGNIAPTLMHLCHLMQELENTEPLQPSHIAMIEKCYYVIIMHIQKANGNVDEAKRILAPLAKKIISLWGQQKQPKAEYYANKQKWAVENTNITEKEICELMEPLARRILEEIRDSHKISSKERLTSATTLLNLQKSPANTNIINELETLLTDHFDEWLLMTAEEISMSSEKKDDLELINKQSFELIIGQYDFLSSKMEPEKLIDAFNTIVEKYTELDETIREKAFRSLYTLWVKENIEQLSRAEKNGIEPQLQQIKEIAAHVKDIGADEKEKKIAENALSYLEKHYLIWIEAEPAIIEDDERFLELAKKWTEKSLVRPVDNSDSKTYDKIEKNLSAVFDYYHVPINESTSMLANLRRTKGNSILNEIIDDNSLEGTEKASRICDLHFAMRNQDGVISQNDQIDMEFSKAIMPYFRDWQKTDPPFTSIQNPRYKDDWFVPTAKLWIDNQFRDEEMNTSEKERLLIDLAKAFKGYRLTEQEQNEISRPVLESWGESSLKDLHENKESLSDLDKAIHIAEIHNRLRSAGLCQEENEEINRGLTDEMLSVFLAWSEMDKPFSSGLNQKYTDDWFVSVAKEWIEQRLLELDLKAERIENVEIQLIAILKIYQIDETTRNEILAGLRIRWGEIKLADLKQRTDKDPDTILSIAEIHDKLNKYGNLSDVSLEEEIRNELLDYYLEWEKVSRPFASNHDLRYSDDLFVSVTNEWLDQKLEEAHLNSDEFETLEADILSALKNYKAEEEIRIKTRIEIRKLWSNQKLTAVKADDTLDNTQKALEIAGIHSHLRKLYGNEPIEKEIESELDRDLVDLFPEWGEAPKPFASSNRLSYDDDWFVIIAEEWLDSGLRDSLLTSSQLETLEQKLSSVFNIYKIARDRQAILLAPLKTIWGERKLEEILGDSENDQTVKSLAIAGIHNKLRKFDGAISQDLENRLIYNLLELFTYWGQATKPFASSENLRYEDPWFGDVFGCWIQERMDNAYLSSDEWFNLTKQLEEASRGYHLSNGEELLNHVKKKYADEYINENLGSLSGDDTNARMAELLFRDKAVSSDEDLKEKLTDYLAENFVSWALAVPPFRIGSADKNLLGYGYGESFLKIYEKWQENYLADTIGQVNLNDFETTIHKAFDAFRIPQRSFDEHSAKLEYYIKRERFALISNETVTPEYVSEAAGIRKWLENQNDIPENEGFGKELEDYIRDHVDIWLKGDKPLYTEGYGYKDEFALSVLEEWLSGRINGYEWNLADLTELRAKIELLQKEFRHTGKEISGEILKELNLAEQRAYINELQGASLNNEQIKELIDRFASLENADETLWNSFIIRLAENYKTWALTEPAFACKGSNAVFRNSLIIKVTNEWLNNGFENELLTFDEVQQIEKDIGTLFRYSNSSENDRQKQNETIISIEKKWLAKALRNYPEGQLKISQIAAAQNRIQTRNGMLEDLEEQELEKFLVGYFLLWGKENFESEDRGKKYTYNSFPNIIDKWLQTDQIRNENLERTEQLINVLKKVLCQGYGYSQTESEQILRPIIKNKNVILLEEARKHSNEDNLQRILNLYENDPEEYYQQIQALYLDLIKQGIVQEHVSDFLKLQESTWRKTQDMNLKKGIISFLDNTCLAYPTVNRPRELIAVMSKILEDEHYDLTPYISDSAELKGWDQIKGFIINRFIRELFKETSSVSDIRTIWERQYSLKCNVTWDDIVQRETFRKELINHLNDEISATKNPKESIRIIIELISYSTRINDLNYRNTLLEAIYKLILDNYSFLSADPDAMNDIESILKTLEEYHMDVSAIKQSREYITNIYINGYALLLKNWDRDKAIDLLKDHPADMEINYTIFIDPGKFEKTEKWLLMNLLFETPRAKGYGYWDRIFKKAGFQLSELDDKDIRDTKVINFIKCIQWIYDILAKAGIQWALEELRKHLKVAIPNLWKTLHPFLMINPGNVLKKIGMDRDEFTDGFYDWFFRAR